MGWQQPRRSSDGRRGRQSMTMLYRIAIPPIKTVPCNRSGLEPQPLHFPSGCGCWLPAGCLLKHPSSCKQVARDYSYGSPCATAAPAATEPQPCLVSKTLLKTLF